MEISTKEMRPDSKHFFEPMLYFKKDFTKNMVGLKKNIQKLLKEIWIFDKKEKSLKGDIIILNLLESANCEYLRVRQFEEQKANRLIKSLLTPCYESLMGIQFSDSHLTNIEFMTYFNCPFLKSISFLNNPIISTKSSAKWVFDNVREIQFSLTYIQQAPYTSRVYLKNPEQNLVKTLNLRSQQNQKKKFCFQKQLWDLSVSKQIRLPFRNEQDFLNAQQKFKQNSQSRQFAIEDCRIMAKSQFHVIDLNNLQVSVKYKKGSSPAYKHYVLKKELKLSEKPSNLENCSKIKKSKKNLKNQQIKNQTKQSEQSRVNYRYLNEKQQKSIRQYLNDEVWPPVPLDQVKRCQVLKQAGYTIMNESKAIQSLIRKYSHQKLQDMYQSNEQSIDSELFARQVVILEEDYSNQAQKDSEESNLESNLNQKYFWDDKQN